MWKSPAAAALLLKEQALLNTEAVLLVDDHQREFVELDTFLEQRVCPYDHPNITRCDRFERAATFACRQRTMDTANIDDPVAFSQGEAGKPTSEVGEVLFSQ